MIKGLRDRLQRRAGLTALLVGALVFGLLSLAHSKTTAVSVLVPVVKTFVASGSRIESRDIRWISEEKLHRVLPSQLRGFAKTPLFPGEVISPQDVGSFSQNEVLVAIAPTNSEDAAVAIPGSSVDIFLDSGQRVDWQSGPLPVVSRSSGAGIPASIDVAMPLHEALGFEALRHSDTVELVGLTS